jgi:hypothetical protein
MDNLSQMVENMRSLGYEESSLVTFNNTNYSVHKEYPIMILYIRKAPYNKILISHNFFYTLLYHIYLYINTITIFIIGKTCNAPALKYYLIKEMPKRLKCEAITRTWPMGL